MQIWGGVMPPFFYLHVIPYLQSAGNKRQIQKGAPVAVKQALGTAAALVVVFSLSCSYDPEPIGCQFRVESTGLTTVAGIDISPLDSLTAPDRQEIADSLDSGFCPVTISVNISAVNNTTESVLIQELEWISTGEVGGNKEYLCSGEMLYPVRVEPGENRNIAAGISFNAAVLYGEYSSEEIIDFLWATGGPGRIIRDSEHLGRLSLEEAFVTQDTRHGLIDGAGPFTIGLQWVQP